MGIIIGCVATLGAIGMIVVSSVINFTFGTKLGHGFEGIVYGLAFLSGDLIKAYLPISMELAWQDNRRTKVWICFPVFLLLILASLLAGIGLNSTVRSEGQGDVKAAQEEFHRLTADKEALTNELRSLGVVRPVGTIEADIAAKKHDKLYDRSKQCTDATALDSRSLCQDINRLEGDLATAKRAVSLRARLDVISGKLEAVDTTKALSVADPQAQALSRLTGYSEGSIQLFLSILVSLLIELCSALGLWLVEFKLNLPKVFSKRAKPKPALSTPQPETNPGDCPVKLWADSHFAIRVGSKVSSKDVIDSFNSWCRLNDKDKIHANVLGRKLTALGYDRKKIGGQTYYLDIAFKREKPDLKAVI